MYRCDLNEMTLMLIWYFVNRFKDIKHAHKLNGFEMNRSRGENIAFFKFFHSQHDTMTHDE